MHPVGVEPTHLAALEPESSVYANFTTGATGEDYAKECVCRQWGKRKKTQRRRLRRAMGCVAKFTLAGEGQVR